MIAIDCNPWLLLPCFTCCLWRESDDHITCRSHLVVLHFRSILTLPVPGVTMYIEQTTSLFVAYSGRIVPAHQGKLFTWAILLLCNYSF